MKKILALAFLLVLMALPRQVHAGYCGDDVCGAGENCSICSWDCGHCPDETDTIQGNITTPAAKTVRIYGGSSGYVDCPITYLSHVYSAGINTSIRIRIANPSGSSTGAFRLTLYSSLGWFVPKNLTYALNPDGYDSSGWPYWDVPPLGRNESTEVAFAAKGSVGLVDNINLKADTLSRWGGCTRFVPKSGSELGNNISDYLDSINWSQGSTVYYKGNGMALVSLDKNGSFAAINVSAGNFTAITGYGAIYSLVHGYVLATEQPMFYGDISKPYLTLNYSKAAKADAEGECYAITGMDKHTCVDRNSCRYACASVPVCWYVGQVGWPFIDTILDYRLSTDRTNEALEEALNTSHDFEVSPSYLAAESAYSDIEGLNREETNVIFNDIFKKYNFCPPPEYAMPQMIDARRTLLDYMDYSCVEPEEGGIVSESYGIGPALQRAEREAAGLESARMNASIALNASLLANASANCSLNLSINLTGSGLNFTCNISGNGTAINATANVTGNATANFTGNMTANITGNVTGNATGFQNQTGNATGIAANASVDENGTSWQELTEQYPLRQFPDIGSYCPLPAMLLPLLAIGAIRIKCPKGRIGKQGKRKCQLKKTLVRLM